MRCYNVGIFSCYLEIHTFYVKPKKSLRHYNTCNLNRAVPRAEVVKSDFYVFQGSSFNLANTGPLSTVIEYKETMHAKICDNILSFQLRTLFYLPSLPPPPPKKGQTSLSHVNSKPRLLALDGGGIPGPSSLQVLKKLTATVDLDVPPGPFNYFNMIGGLVRARKCTTRSMS